ncbi:hypothetical protein GCM10027203_07950 [Nonomuraea fastidiosa]
MAQGVLKAGPPSARREPSGTCRWARVAWCRVWAVWGLLGGARRLVSGAGGGICRMGARRLASGAGGAGAAGRTRAAQCQARAACAELERQCAAVKQRAAMGRRDALAHTGRDRWDLPEGRPPEGGCRWYEIAPVRGRPKPGEWRRGDLALGTPGGGGRGGWVRLEPRPVPRARGVKPAGCVTPTEAGGV